MQRFSFKTAAEAWYIVSQYLPNPDQVLVKKQSSISIYRALLSDPHLGACLSSREATTSSKEWVVEKRDCPEPLYQAINEWFVNILERKRTPEDLNRKELIDNLLDCFYYGYQPVELIWGYEKPLWLPMGIYPKPPEWFGYWINDQGNPEMRFFGIENSIDGIKPKPWTLSCLRLKPSYDNPYGQGVASRCFWPITFKRAGTEFWMNFMERFGTPWVKGKMGVNTEGIEKFKNDLKSLVQDAVVVVSGDKDVELLESKTTKEVGFEALMDFMDSQVSKAILGHTLNTDVKDKSSYAATKGAMGIRDDLVKSDEDLVASFFNDLLWMIFARNGYYDTPRPQVTPFRPEIIDVERAQRDESLSRSGVRFSQKYYERAYHFEEGDIEEISEPEGKQVLGTQEEPDGNTSPGGKQRGNDPKRKSGGSKTLGK